MQLKGYMQITTQLPYGGVQTSTHFMSTTYTRDGMVYDIPKPIVPLVGVMGAQPIIGYRQNDPATLYVIDFSQWILVDFEQGRAVTTEAAQTTDPYQLRPLAERYLREARHLDSLALEQWMARLMNQSSDAAAVVRPAIGTGL